MSTLVMNVETFPFALGAGKCKHPHVVKRIQQLTEDIPVVIDATKLKPFGHQVSGHAVLYKLDGGKIIKPSNAHEVEVYKALQKHHSLLPFVAGFYGTTTPPPDLSLKTTTRTQAKMQEDTRRENIFIIMEDLTHKYKYPCLMDIKLGQILYEPDAPLEKKLREDRKAHETTTHEFGVRVDGIRVYKPRSAEFTVRKQDYGWKHSVEDNLRLFLDNGDVIRTDLIPHFVAKLEKLFKVVFKHTKSFNFLQSSLLLIYEGDVSRSPPSSPQINTAARVSEGAVAGEENVAAAVEGVEFDDDWCPVDVRLIDFDHTHTTCCKFGDHEEEDVGDCGCTVGIKSLMNSFSTLAQDKSHNI
jgi:hypothetical protein